VILTYLEDALIDANDDVRAFFGNLVCIAPRSVTIREVSSEFGIRPSTLTSRFYRARLPAPKRYLAMLRLVYASSLFESRGASISDVANRLRYSSPQSFGRNVQLLLGMTAGEYRSQFPFNAALKRFAHDLIVPYWNTLKVFLPLAPRSMWLPPPDGAANYRSLNA
jgi:AraC-like DNA-binding protein